jgi:transposase-like protein
MDDTGTSSTWEERFANHLREKQAGPLVCPICTATRSFEPKGLIGEFGYAACSNCGYSIFFDGNVTGLQLDTYPEVPQ